MTTALSSSITSSVQHKLFCSVLYLSHMAELTERLLPHRPTTHHQKHSLSTAAVLHCSTYMRTSAVDCTTCPSSITHLNITS
jgi:hypothetical protein